MYVHSLRCIPALCPNVPGIDSEFTVTLTRIKCSRKMNECFVEEITILLLIALKCLGAPLLSLMLTNTVLAATLSEQVSSYTRLKNLSPYKTAVYNDVSYCV